MTAKTAAAAAKVAAAKPAATTAPVLDLKPEAEVFQQTRKTVVNPFLDAVKALEVGKPGVSVGVPSDNKDDATLKTYNRYLTEAGNKVGVTVRREVRKVEDGSFRLFFQATPKIARKPKPATV